MDETESEGTADASKNGDKISPFGGDIQEQGQSSSWNDIPNFGFGKFIIYANLVFTILAVVTGGRLLTPPRAPGEAVPRSASLFSLFFLIVMMALFLGLRKRKKFGLLMFYMLEGLQILSGFIMMLARPVSSTEALRTLANEPFFRVIRGGLTIGIACALLVYFYRRRQYFNR